MRLLYVEDDHDLGKATFDGLKEEYAIDWFQTIADASEAFANVEYDLILLDINLPGTSGLQWLQKLRTQKTSIPILLLTARDTVAQRVEGLEAGADDYLVKPYDFDELIARIRALTRRREKAYQATLEYEDLTIDFSSKSITQKGKQINLPRREFEIFRILLEQPGRVISKEQIAEKIYSWDDEFESNTIEVHVSSLRRKIGKDYIKTLRGLGYMVKKDNEK
jgi:DNA-binding response OmpR family regulator